VKVSDLTGPLLNAWVAKAEGYKHRGAIGEPYDPERRNDHYRYCRDGHNDWWDNVHGEWLCGPCYGVPNDYSGSWEHGGAILEREGIGIERVPRDPARWGAHREPWADGRYVIADTPLEAAMRARVAQVFGDEVPDTTLETE
jgi:hypothetical protein